MAVYKCGGQRRFDDAGEPACTYESEHPWRGACPVELGGCGRLYNIEKVGVDKKFDRKRVTAGDVVNAPPIEHVSTGISVLDGVLSGGVVKGSTIVFVGVPGGGKSSLWFEACDAISDREGKSVLYVTSEQSIQKLMQIPQRLGIVNDKIEMVSTKNIHEVLQVREEVKPLVTVYDSLQNFRLGDGDATARETEEIVDLITQHTQRQNNSSVIISQIAKDLSMRGGTKAIHNTETEVYLYKFDDEQDRRATHQLLGRDTRLKIRSGAIDADKLRILICGKNRDGEEGRKTFFLMTKEGQIQPLDQIAD